jgi:N-acetylglucosaminyldiphosphoundecaprenol N-acetyl-beta-D-mannosaminyltransferase
MTAAVPKSTAAWGTAATANERGPLPSPAIPVEGPRIAAVARAGRHDDLSREVYCILGMPIDAVDMPTVVERIEAALDRPDPLFISTPNLNFLTATQTDPEFRESLLLSDLCPADGMPIVWVARLMGIPIKKRIAGSDIIMTLKAERTCTRQLNVFFFGGTEGIATAAGTMLNASRCSLRCVGSMFPGFGTVEDLSCDDIIDNINSTEADFLIASLGAQKGQAWLLRNHHRLRIPIRAHLGAVLNFEAGTIKRAPPKLREMGLEWLWRIKEEPHLWRRYWNDAMMTLRLMLTHVLPLTLAAQWMRRRCQRTDLSIAEGQDEERVTLTFSGMAARRQVDVAVSAFRKALAAQKDVAVDLSDVDFIDQRFLGLLMVLRKQLRKAGSELHVVGASTPLKRLFRLNGGEFLIAGAAMA